MNGRVCVALVQFGCYQHKHKWMSSSPIYIYPARMRRGKVIGRVIVVVVVVIVVDTKIAKSGDVRT